MSLIQYHTADGRRAVGLIDAQGAVEVPGVETVYGLALEAIAAGTSLAAAVAAKGRGAAIDPATILADGRMLAPVDHPDPAHLFLTGTGLTHLGSASTRDAMHKKTSEAAEETLTDSMKMFRMGLEGGKPAPGTVGVQPEWFYKGTGFSVVAPEQPIPSPAFARDAGEEPEMAGIYIIGKDGTPWRLGFALANEFSDHVTERVNYLYLAHSKLRHASYGPQLRLGALPANVSGVSRIRRDGKVIWEKPFLSGEDNMSHTIENLEHHHFKYELFRQPGDVHVHMFGTATLSFADGIRTEPGDVFEIEEAQFGLPLRNPVAIEGEKPVRVRSL
ncbi:AraD1 family protein [Devosia enhydra]|uniref:AraD1 family protein n=1 Tax=Devosia enhydra TaxID=665118 RepID=UPI000A05CD99